MRRAIPAQVRSAIFSDDFATERTILTEVYFLLRWVSTSYLAAGFSVQVSLRRGRFCPAHDSCQNNTASTKKNQSCSNLREGPNHGVSIGQLLVSRVRLGVVVDNSLIRNPENSQSQGHHQPGAVLPYVKREGKEGEREGEME